MKPIILTFFFCCTATLPIYVCLHKKILNSIFYIHRSIDGLNNQSFNENVQRFPLSNVQNLQNNSSKSPSIAANIKVHSPMNTIFPDGNSKSSKPFVKYPIKW